MKLKTIPEFGPGDGIWYIRRDDRPEPVHFAQINMIDDNVVHVLDKIIGCTKIGKKNMFKSKHEAYKALHKLNEKHELAELEHTAYDAQTNAKINETVFVLPEDYLTRIRADEPVNIIEAYVLDLRFGGVTAVGKEIENVYDTMTGSLILNQDELDTFLCSDMGRIEERIKDLEDDISKLKKWRAKLKVIRRSVIGIAIED